MGGTPSCPITHHVTTRRTRHTSNREHCHYRYLHSYTTRATLLHYATAQLPPLTVTPEVVLLQPRDNPRDRSKRPTTPDLAGPAVPTKDDLETSDRHALSVAQQQAEASLRYSMLSSYLNDDLIESVYDAGCEDVSAFAASFTSLYAMLLLVYQ